jgi:hypothetical protein
LIVGYNTVQLYATLLRDQYLPTSTHQILYWDGLDDSGHVAQLTPQDSQFIFTLGAFTLPDNGVMVAYAPQITSLKCDANLFQASRRDYVQGGTVPTRIDLELSGDAAVEIKVVAAASGRELRSWRTDTLPAGPNRITWDGKTADGRFLASGDYRMSLVAVDGHGSRSIVRYVPFRIFH